MNHNYHPSRARARLRTMQSVVKGLLLTILIIALIIGTWLLSSLYLMVGVGIAHLDWWHAMPVMGYHTALLLDIFIGGFIGFQLALSSFGRSGRRKS